MFVRHGLFRGDLSGRSALDGVDYSAAARVRRAVVGVDQAGRRGRRQLDVAMHLMHVFDQLGERPAEQPIPAAVGDCPSEGVVLRVGEPID